MNEFSRPKSLTELVTENIRNRVISGDLKLGEQLSEVKISKELEISRTPVREAFNRLEMEGLLNVEPQRGTFVFGLKPDELSKLCDARVCLETAALTHAITENPDGLYQALNVCLAKMAKARNSENIFEYLALDTAFHQCFFDFSENRFLCDAYQTVALKMAAVRNRLERHPETLEKSFQEHMELADAIQKRDICGALKVLRSHIDRNEDTFWSEVTKYPDVAMSLAK